MNGIRETFATMQEVTFCRKSQRANIHVELQSFIHYEIVTVQQSQTLKRLQLMLWFYTSLPFFSQKWTLFNFELHQVLPESMWNSIWVPSGFYLGFTGLYMGSTWHLAGIPDKSHVSPI